MIQKSIDRLKYTFSKGNKPNQNDFIALNDVINYVNTERQTLQNNQLLFSKLFLNQFKDVLIKSEGNYQLAIDSVKKVCRVSLDVQLDSLIEEANQIFLSNHLKEYTEDPSKFEYPKYDRDKMKARLMDLITNMIEDYN